MSQKVTMQDVNRARLMTLGSWAINFAAQTYGMLTKPNMKDIHDTYHYAFSPNPMFIGVYFSMQVVIQLTWISKLWRPSGGRKDDASAYGEPSQLKYAPIYALGNLCIAGWMLFWNNENFVMSQALVTVNSFAQFYAVFVMLPPMTADNVWTHLTAQTFAGIGVLDFVDNGAVVLRLAGPPSTAIQVVTGLVFGLGALLTNPIFSATMLYNLVGLYFGQSGVWAKNLAWMIFATGIVVFFKLLTFKVPGQVRL
ncbi:hypothetical protein GLOTRDRAFT_67311 [Gloeophyllum trabeum ATCC 11539]|uniref:DUF1774-domain-containing protein n=1 Tax=Gloeophyllum trabeum (strain ATCC 11539 / FP-39264 / Madison 617) TaxID=670483 RepID=S7QJY2_GLOTA|nr:uncharacterized protein GLOTRDRAFT_67311 [Gloeophyllum trabeum ATCC 11539]EPQ60021.1 hypothetical protein GLOTRDRAFT_67311 [Gloeophyllum trabeum ATCC 11539]